MTTPDSSKFDEIRPYNDSEVAEVIERLLHTPEFITALSKFRFPKLSRWLPFVTEPLVRAGLGKQLAGIRDVRALQQVIAHYMQSMIDRTTGKLSFSGIERLDPERAYLFISNHRDIAMDPAFVNWGLFSSGMDTVRIAIGDNLLRKPYVSDLMRLNKSFIVNRSASGVREKLKALTQLSCYIDHSICSGHSIWIAQREGRAKDGNDRTDPAILKMLSMGPKKRGLSFSEGVKALSIVPVSISYEYDPCDALKAGELQALDSEGSYEKSQYEDIESIVQGIVGFKGDVHVAFGEPIEAEFDNAEQLAEEIDRQVILNYHLHASNLLAAEQTNEQLPAAKRDGYLSRLNEVDPKVRPWFVAQYANPVLSKRQLNAEGGK
ncbi:1-acyl-sn-glycerol-3-phosphate acyltransferase [Motiliproteus sp.]|uniref:1-acyl-sn-glycerol-3-phosphate acyltransferase n=1 Tax=Motiliproteus sp. TaxID=1898955 RepID=UPI003BA9D9AC